MSRGMRAQWLTALVRRYGRAGLARPDFEPAAAWTFDAWLAHPRSGDFDDAELRPLPWAARQLGIRSTEGARRWAERRGVRVVRGQVVEPDFLEQLERDNMAHKNRMAC